MSPKEQIFQTEVIDMLLPYIMVDRKKFKLCYNDLGLNKYRVYYSEIDNDSLIILETYYIVDENQDTSLFDGTETITYVKLIDHITIDFNNRLNAIHYDVINENIANGKITKEQFLEAQQIVGEYKMQVAEKNFQEFTCISCKTNKIVGESFFYDSDINKIGNAAFWCNGTVFNVHFGYGSKLDTNVYSMALCDDCTTNLHKDKIIFNNKTDIWKIYKENFHE